MFWEKCKISFFEKSSREFVKIYGYEVVNKTPYWVYIEKKHFEILRQGSPINIALKDYSQEIREFLIAGFAYSTDSIFTFNREPIPKAFITNAVAKSVAFYAQAYLNNKGLPPDKIKELRKNFSFNNLEKRNFTIEELKSKFVEQSVLFLNIYKEMNENNTFKKFAESLEQQNRFNSVFKKYKNSFNLLEQYNRRIYHNKLECNYIRNDYEEETFHKNTGVYLEKQKLSRQHFHQVDAHYLNEINMRLCKICIKRV
tara:strand:+ start:996 stop:1763 length:768 start_codon:yes stop_codon:yes gene_type:complete